MTILTTQEAFTRIVIHCCLVQTEQSSDGKACRYAGPNANSCAIGCLLPRPLGRTLDRLQDPSWSAIRESNNQTARKAVRLLGHLDQDVLRVCQCVHDNYTKRNPTSRKLMWQDFERIAEDYLVHMPTVMEIGDILHGCRR
jgi:hypothetical protein